MNLRNIPSSCLGVLIIFVFVTLFGLGPPFAEAQVYAYVANGDGTVSVIDTDTNLVVATIPVGPGPYGIAISPDGFNVYVSNTADGTVSVIDTELNIVIDTISYGGGGSGALAFTPDGASLYLVAQVGSWDGGSPQLWEIDTTSNTVVDNVLLPLSRYNTPQDIAITPDGTRAYVADFRAGWVTVVDLSSNTVLYNIGVSGTFGIAITPTSNLAFCATSNSVVKIINTVNDTVTHTVPLALNLRDAAISPNGAFAYVVSASGVLAVLDATSYALVTQIQTGSGKSSGQIAFTPDGSAAYVTHSGSDDVSVVDTSTITEIATIPVGASPKGVAVMPIATITVDIDIKPGSYPNSINLGSNGNVPVAIFSTEDFDATTVDPLTITLAGAEVRIRGKGDQSRYFEDVNGDGHLDVIVHVDTKALELSSNDTEAILEGKTFEIYGGTKIRGMDTVRIVDE